jgi:hypothetical protein
VSVVLEVRACRSLNGGLFSPRGPSTVTTRERILILTFSGISSVSFEKMYLILGDWARVQRVGELRLSTRSICYLRLEIGGSVRARAKFDGANHSWVCLGEVECAYLGMELHTHSCSPSINHL